MTGTPTVSVVMNCLNGADFVQAALGSVYAQVFGDWEVVFLDNASTDASGTIARGFDDRVRYLRNESTVPLGHARNQALAAARGEFIAFLDVDDCWRPDKLERQLPLFDQPGVDFVFSDTELHFAETGARVSYFEHHGYRPPRGRIFHSLLRHYAIPMLTTVVRARALRAMPEWFDDRFLVCDDFDFFMRLARGTSCDYVDDVLATCLIHAKQATVVHQARIASEMRRTLEKLEQLDPALSDTHAADVAAFLRRVDYAEARALWAAGRGGEARRLLARHWRSPKCLATAAASWLPLRLVNRLHASWR